MSFRLPEPSASTPSAAGRPPSRRAFLGASAAGLAALSASVTAEPEQPRAGRRAVIKPPKLAPGDTVGLIDPASPTWEPVDVDVVVESLAALGLKAKRGQNLLNRRGYFAGSDRERAADLNAMLTDPEVKAIQSVRGGWGSARVLSLLDWAAIAKQPKIVLGFSDVTALLLPIHARTGMVTFHGPNGRSLWNEFNVGWIRRVLMQGDAVTFENLKDVGDNLTQVENRTQTITPGTARGRLLGGNLTVLTSLIGSAFLPDFDGCVLFIEDVNEEPYRVDRMFTQLQLAGILQKARALVWGTCYHCNPRDGFGSLTVTDILDDHVKPLGIPAFQGAMIGHVDRQFTLPIGVEVEIDASAGTIRMLESAVS